MRQRIVTIAIPLTAIAIESNSQRKVSRLLMPWTIRVSLLPLIYGEGISWLELSIAVWQFAVMLPSRLAFLAVSKWIKYHWMHPVNTRARQLPMYCNQAE